MRGIFPLGIAVLTFMGASLVGQTIHGRDGISLPAPPPVDSNPVTDNYSGAKIVDNYRWLEDQKSEETRAFIDAENAYTGRYMKQARLRPQVVDDLTDLEDVSAAGTPLQRGESYFFRKRLAGEQQFSIYVRQGWTGPGEASRDKRLVDPAVLSTDPNMSVGIEDVSRDGKLLAYSVHEGGADEVSIHILNVVTHKELEDELPTARYLSAVFAADGASLYYARNNKQGTLLYQHLLGTRNSKDALIFGREFRGEPLTGNDLFGGYVTDDGHYLVVQISRGVPAKRVDIVYRDLTKPGSTFEVLVWGLDSRFSEIYAKGAWYVKTDYKASSGCIYKADPGIMPDDWKMIVPEQPNAIDAWSIVGGKIYVSRLKDVKTETSVYSLDGKPSGTVDYDGIGSVSRLDGRTTLFQTNKS